MRARAKINLYLHVLGKRDDGYHLLDSLIVFAEFGDEIAVAPSSDLTLTLDGPFAGALSAEADNLVLRAGRGLKQLAHDAAGAAIRLTKNLPVASGIGGGSADAAATLLALADLWQVRIDQKALMDLALGLGADVPVCLDGRASFVGGIGEVIAPAGRLPAAWFVLVNPGVATPTPAVFRARNGSFSESARWSRAPQTFDQLIAHLKATRNDLTEPAISVTPVIGEVLSELEALPDCRLARLSGSGATCFGIFADETSASSAAVLLKSRRPDWWVMATRMAD